MRIEYNRSTSNSDRPADRQRVIGFYSDDGSMGLRLIFQSATGISAEITLTADEAKTHLKLMQAIAS